MTAGTLFDRRRTPLTVWFTACWMFAPQKDGVSALSLQRSLEIGSYPTAWAMLHRLRSVLVRPGRDRLTGTVEVDETYIGGEEPGLRGGRAQGKKSLVGVAVEVKQPRGYGRCRMAILADASAASLHPFVTGARRAGGNGHSPTAGWATAGWRGSVIPVNGAASGPPAPAMKPRRAAARRAPRRLPGEAMAAGHPPGLVEDAHLPAYLNEFVLPLQPARAPAAAAWSSTRCWSWPSGHDPVRFRDLLVSPSPTSPRPRRPGRRVIRQALTAQSGPALADRSPWHSPVR